MSEELLAKGYMKSNGQAEGARIGDFEGLNIGATTLAQLKAAKLIPDINYIKPASKPDALIVDRRNGEINVKLIIEHKDLTELDSENKRTTIASKVAEVYCKQLKCPIAVLTDGTEAYWILYTGGKNSWVYIFREDGYPLDTPADLTSFESCKNLAATLTRLDRDLNLSNGKIEPEEPANPTGLAEQTWQTIWLASGENPDACLATFVEILLFKFLSDLKLLTTDSNTGIDLTFKKISSLPDNQALNYYFSQIRPQIKTYFPPGADGTSIINGIVLDPKNTDHGKLFNQIIKKFEEFGDLTRIDPEFKSRIFEKFLKKSISQKNWGQFFTPRNVVKAMVEMSGIEALPAGATVADPACGVGGFLLEPLVNKRPGDFRGTSSGALNYKGWDRDSKTVILAKANMLIHLSEVLENDPSNAAAYLSPILNTTFSSTSQSITGSLSLVPRHEYDLVMTNPPYVVAGTSTQRAMIAADSSMASYYKATGSGVENLFLQLIINGLKDGARALVVVPDGLLLRHSEEALKRTLLKQCIIEAIISLPEDTFYSTPKKTYILVFRKKTINALQTTPVLTYLVTEVGETLDSKRFIIPNNHLPRMSQLFRIFQGAPDIFEIPAEEKRAKLFPISDFKPESHWLVDRWWTEDERVDLGALDAKESISPEDLSERLHDISKSMAEIASYIQSSEHKPQTQKTRPVRLDDAALFKLSIGKRVLKKELHGLKPGPIPLYSANVTEPFGFIESINLHNFDNPSVIWGIDGDFELAVKAPSVPFAITDHCGRIEILDSTLDAGYCRASIALARAHGFDRTLRPSLQRMRTLEFEVPITTSGDFDLEAQKALASRYEAVVDALTEAERAFRPLLDLQPNVMGNAEDG